MRTTPTRLDLSQVGYRLQSEDGYVETGTYEREELMEGEFPGEWIAVGCEGCSAPSTWGNTPDDMAKAGYSGFAYCDDCIESALNPEGWGEGVSFEHFAR